MVQLTDDVSLSSRVARWNPSFPSLRNKEKGIRVYGADPQIGYQRFLPGALKAMNPETNKTRSARLMVSGFPAHWKQSDGIWPSQVGEDRAFYMGRYAGESPV